MGDVITIFIRSERLADYDGHLYCIVTRMLNIFSDAGHHQYAKGGRLYGKLMKQLENLPSYKDALESFTAHGKHVVRYSCHEWSGTWCDICIEQTLMNTAKSERGLSRGRMRNSDSGHKCWVQTLNHFSDVNYLMEVAVKKHGPFHKDLTKTRMKRDSEVIELALKWWKKNNPFDHNWNIIVSFSTGFTTHEHCWWCNQCWESDWSREGNADKAGWKVSDIDYGGEVQGKCLVIAQKDFQGQREED